MFSTPKGLWALVLGGSSGFGLASAHSLAKLGLNLFIVHRDRKSTLKLAQAEFDKIASYGVQVKTFNSNALDSQAQDQILSEIESTLEGKNNLRLVLHSIAMGNLKPLVKPKHGDLNLSKALAIELNLPEEKITEAVSLLAKENGPAWKIFTEDDELNSTLSDEDMNLTIYSMGTSLMTWVQKIFEKGLFFDDARVIGLTSEGNQKAMKGYAAVSCAKASLETLSRAIAAELGPYGIRSNLVQAGCTLTPSFQKIPNHEKLEAQAKMRNPLGRLTTPEDVADVIAFLATDQAKWINGTILTVDGGEKICG